MKDFILEVGKDFTFIDEEFRVQVGSEDYRIDLLFFHRGLQCLVAFELKIGLPKRLIVKRKRKMRTQVLE